MYSKYEHMLYQQVLLQLITKNLKAQCIYMYLHVHVDQCFELEFYRTHTLCALSTVSTDCAVAIL